MKRKLFFWLEKLKINRGERQAVATLMVIFLLLLFVNSFMPANTSIDDNFYAPLEEAFKIRSELLEKKDEKLLARYRPQENEEVIAVRDTTPGDTSQVANSVTDSAAAPAKVNVNTASSKALESLPGIGPTYAGRIIEYRQKNGSYTSFEELLKIKGIGKKRLEKLLPFIQLKEPIEN